MTKMILKKVYISRGGGQGQFGKSLHFDFFFYDGFPKKKHGKSKNKTISNSGVTRVRQN